MSDISFNTACKEMKIAQIAQLNQLFQLFHLAHIYGHCFYKVSRMLMSKNDVSKDSPIPTSTWLWNLNMQICEIFVVIDVFHAVNSRQTVTIRRLIVYVKSKTKSLVFFTRILPACQGLCQKGFWVCTRPFEWRACAEHMYSRRRKETS